MRSKAPGKFESELLQFLADSEGMSVRQIQDSFGVQRGYVRGTIVKAMDRLFRKGLVKRETVEGVFVYKAAVTSDELEMQIVRSFINERLGGRIQPLAAFFSSHELTEAQRKELLEALEELRGTNSK
jgi:predicted transcriptional regulator